MELISIYLMRSEEIIINVSNGNKIEEDLGQIEINSEERFQTFLDSFPRSILLLDINKKIYFCNKAAELYLNKSLAEVLNKSFYTLFIITEENKAIINEIIDNVILIDFSEIFDLEFVNQKGLKTWIELYFSSIEFRNKKFVQIIIQDITERKIAEKIIRDENLRLKEINSIKKDMTTKASEQLKTPLSIIAKASELLIHNYQDQLNQDVINLLDLIKEGSENSLSLVGKIVNISEIESDNLILNKQIDNLTVELKKTIISIKNDYQKHGIMIELDIQDDIYSEFDKLRMNKAFKDLFLNLLESNKIENLTISAKIEEYLGIIRIICVLKKSIVPLGPITNSFSKKIIKLHGGDILIDESKIPDKFSIEIQLPIKKWRDNLIGLFVICKSGIPLFDYAFRKTDKYRDTSLISGGIIGLMTILKAILQGNTHIKSIDHGDRTIIFDLNQTRDIVFVLIVKEHFSLFENKLNSLIHDFDIVYSDLIREIDKNSSDLSNWQDIELLVRKHFVT